MTPETGQQIITIQILPNVPRTRDNQKIKYGRLVKYNMRNIFLEKSYTKYVGEASPRPFYRKP